METQTQYREAVETAVANVFQRTSLPEQAVFRKEGEYWAIGRGGNAFRLKDTKGLGYLAHLLRHPAAEFHVLDLAGGIAGQREIARREDSRNFGDLRPQRLSLGPHAKANRAHTRGFHSIL
jgi:hypothetical protein